MSVELVNLENGIPKLSLANRLISCLIAVLVCSLLSTKKVSGNEQTKTIAKIQQLDEKSGQLATKIFSRLPSKITFKEIQSLKDFFSGSNKTMQPKDNLELLSIIHKNLQVIITQLDVDLSAKVIQHLLDNNDYLTAKYIYESIATSGDPLIIAKSSIPFANYHNSRNQWHKSMAFLDIELDELAESDLSQAAIATGIALQGLKQHRQSIKQYQKVKPGTSSFNAAQINTAIALLRQDWWTDAHIVIQDLLKLLQKNDSHVELQDRLYLMLGYSFFNKEYYRESRESFRSISLDSQYTNKAIMGLVLSAIAQQDYTGAYNTLTILNNKNANDLVIEESYLLLPNLKQKLNDYAAANDAYLTAIDYYEERISQLSLITPAMLSSGFEAAMTPQVEKLTVANTSFRLTSLYPNYFQENLRQLNQLSQLSDLISDNALNKKIKDLKLEYRKTFDSAISDLVQQRIEALTSYLSQAKYGLAQLYDETDD